MFCNKSIPSNILSFGFNVATALFQPLVRNALIFKGLLLSQIISRSLRMFNLENNQVTKPSFLSFNNTLSCGVNFSFDGYWPCSQGSAIARLFKMYNYRKSTLPKSEADWDGIDENGDAKVHDSGMWDICKLCQLAAKKPMDEKIFGRPISISYRKALGMEGNDGKLSKHVTDSHKKNLKQVPIFRKRDDNKN